MLLLEIGVRQKRERPDCTGQPGRRRGELCGVRAAWRGPAARGCSTEALGFSRGFVIRRTLTAWGQHSALVSPGERANRLRNDPVQAIKNPPSTMETPS